MHVGSLSKSASPLPRIHSSHESPLTTFPLQLLHKIILLTKQNNFFKKVSFPPFSTVEVPYYSSLVVLFLIVITVTTNVTENQ